MKKFIQLAFFALFPFNLLGKEVAMPDNIDLYFDQPYILGSYRLYYFGFNLYDIQAIIEKDDINDQNRSKIAIQVTYNRDIDKDDLIDSSIEEVAQVSGFSEEEVEKKYKKTFEEIFSDVKQGDQKVAISDGKILTLYHNENLGGKVADEFFAKNFVGMWLHEKASRQKMRKKLLNLDE